MKCLLPAPCVLALLAAAGCGDGNSRDSDPLNRLAGDPKTYVDIVEEFSLGQRTRVAKEVSVWTERATFQIDVPDGWEEERRGSPYGTSRTFRKTVAKRNGKRSRRRIDGYLTIKVDTNRQMPAEQEAKAHYDGLQRMNSSEYTYRSKMRTVKLADGSAAWLVSISFSEDPHVNPEDAATQDFEAGVEAVLYVNDKLERNNTWVIRARLVEQNEDGLKTLLPSRAALELLEQCASSFVIKQDESNQQSD